MINLGVGPIPEGVAGSGSLSAFPATTFQTQLLDLTQAQLNIELIPARPGYFPIPTSGNWVIEQASGTLVTPPTTRAGSDVGHTNFIPQAATTPSAANVNAANPPSLASGPANAGNTVQRIPNTPVILDVVAGASGTGAFALKGRLQITVFWFPSGGL